MPARRWPSTAGVNPKAQVYDQRPRLASADLLAPLDQGVEAHSGTGTLDAVASFGQTGRKADGGTGALAAAATLAQSSRKSAAGTGAIGLSYVISSVGEKEAYTVYIGKGGPQEGAGSGSGGGLDYVALLSGAPVTLLSDADGTTPLTAEDGIAALIADLPLSAGTKDALGAGTLAASASFASAGSRTGAGSGTLVLTVVQSDVGSKSSSGTGTVILSASLAATGTGASSSATEVPIALGHSPRYVPRTQQPRPVAPVIRRSGTGLLVLSVVMDAIGVADDDELALEWLLAA